MSDSNGGADQYEETVRQRRADFSKALTYLLDAGGHFGEASQLTQLLESSAKCMLEFDTTDSEFFALLHRACLLDQRLAALSDSPSTLKSDVYRILNANDTASVDAWVEENLIDEFNTTVGSMGSIDVEPGAVFERRVEQQTEGENQITWISSVQQSTLDDDAVINQYKEEEFNRADVHNPSMHMPGAPAQLEPHSRRSSRTSLQSEQHAQHAEHDIMHAQHNSTGTWTEEKLLLDESNRQPASMSPTQVDASDSPHQIEPHTLINSRITSISSARNNILDNEIITMPHIQRVLDNVGQLDPAIYMSIHATDLAPAISETRSSSQTIVNSGHLHTPHEAIDAFGTEKQLGNDLNEKVELVSSIQTDAIDAETSGHRNQQHMSNNDELHSITQQSALHSAAVESDTAVDAHIERLYGKANMHEPWTHGLESEQLVPPISETRSSSRTSVEPGQHDTPHVPIDALSAKTQLVEVGSIHSEAEVTGGSGRRSQQHTASDSQVTYAPIIQPVTKHSDTVAVHHIHDMPDTADVPHPPRNNLVQTIEPTPHTSGQDRSSRSSLNNEQQQVHLEAPSGAWIEGKLVDASNRNPPVVESMDGESAKIRTGHRTPIGGQAPQISRVRRSTLHSEAIDGETMRSNTAAHHYIYDEAEITRLHDPSIRNSGKVPQLPLPNSGPRSTSRRSSVEREEYKTQHEVDHDREPTNVLSARSETGFRLLGTSLHDASIAPDLSSSRMIRSSEPRATRKLFDAILRRDVVREAETEDLAGHERQATLLKLALSSFTPSLETSAVVVNHVDTSLAHRTSGASDGADVRAGSPHGTDVSAITSLDLSSIRSESTNSPRSGYL